MEYTGSFNWFERHADKEAKMDSLKTSDRVGNIVGAAICLLIAFYFTDLYSSDSGFFDPDITDIELFLFMWVAFFGAVPNISKALLGRKNVTRPLDVLLSISVVIALVAFLSSFPFDLEHLDSSLPEALRFLVSWIDDGIAKIMMWLGLIFSLVNVPYTVVLYFSVRKRLRGR